MKQGAAIDIVYIESFQSGKHRRKTTDIHLSVLISELASRSKKWRSPGQMGNKATEKPEITLQLDTIRLLENLNVSILFKFLRLK